MFRYTYTSDFFGYEIRYDGEMIDGLCTIHAFVKDKRDMWRIYHRKQAQKKLIEILKSKNLWKV